MAMEVLEPKESQNIGSKFDPIPVMLQQEEFEVVNDLEIANEEAESDASTASTVVSIGEVQGADSGLGGVEESFDSDLDSIIAQLNCYRSKKEKEIQAAVESQPVAPEKPETRSIDVQNAPIMKDQEVQVNFLPTQEQVNEFLSAFMMQGKK